MPAFAMFESCAEQSFPAWSGLCELTQKELRYIDGPVTWRLEREITSAGCRRWLALVPRGFL